MSLAINHLNQLASRHSHDGGNRDDVAEPVGLWVPSERVLVFRVELPKVSRRKQQEMLPWLLEDRLLSSPDDFEFILGAQAGRGPDGGDSAAETLVYVIEKAALGQWLLLAEAAAVSPTKMVPDFLSLSYEEGRWTVYTDKGRLLVRTGLYEGFAANLEFGWQQLELLLAQHDESIRLSHLTSSAMTLPENLLDRLDTETGKINWAFTELPVGLDVLPSAYRPKRSSSFGVWVPAIAAGVLLVVLSLSYMLVQSWGWQRDALVLDVAVTDAYEALFSTKLPDVLLSGHALNVAESAREQLALLEHQYIATQTSPLGELGALDRVFSTCSDCVLMGVSQSDSGINARLKDNARLKTRLDSVEGWSIDWGNVDAKGINSLSMQRRGAQ